MSYDEHLISMAGGDGDNATDQLAAIEARRGPEGAPSPSPRAIAAAEAIQALEAQDHESDPEYPSLTEHGALRLAAAAIAASQLVDMENGIVRIRRSEIQKALTHVNVPALLALVRELRAKLEAIGKITEKFDKDVEGMETVDQTGPLADEAISDIQTALGGWS